MRFGLLAEDAPAGRSGRSRNSWLRSLLRLLGLLRLRGCLLGCLSNLLGGLLGDLLHCLLGGLWSSLLRSLLGTAFLTAFFAALGAALAFAAFLAAGFAAFTALTAFFATFLTAFFFSLLRGGWSGGGDGGNCSLLRDLLLLLGNCHVFHLNQTPQALVARTTYSVPDPRGFVKRSSRAATRRRRFGGQQFGGGGAGLGVGGCWGVGLARRQVDPRQHAADRTPRSFDGRDG
jgi:hypothetical protein